MKLIAIVAHDPNRLIGADGDLPWHLPEDLAFFKKTTSGHPIVMGRKTFESIGRPLPKRQNIVLTRDHNWQAEGVTIIHTPAALNTVDWQKPDPVFIIGGAEVYQQFLPLLDELMVTSVKKTYQGDTYFPEYSEQFIEAETLQENEEFSVIRFVRKAFL
ncbi:dihydrofolate reductase [Roseibacillus persicicus]|uniref:dihydrofolate reductase n=1 Tax=Roseibacillus persicicus TaxID=454148 RepID=UPI00398B6DCD